MSKIVQKVVKQRWDVTLAAEQINTYNAGRSYSIDNSCIANIHSNENGLKQIFNSLLIRFKEIIDNKPSGQDL